MLLPRNRDMQLVNQKADFDVIIVALNPFLLTTLSVGKRLKRQGKFLLKVFQTCDPSAKKRPEHETLLYERRF